MTEKNTIAAQPAKPDPYIEAKLDEVLNAFCSPLSITPGTIMRASDPRQLKNTRANLRLILVQIYQDGHEEGVKDGAAEEAASAEAADPEPPEQDECND